MMDRRNYHKSTIFHGIIGRVMLYSQFRIGPNFVPERNSSNGFLQIELRAPIVKNSLDCVRNLRAVRKQEIKRTDFYRKH